MSAEFPWGSKETQFFFELTPERILSAVESFGFYCTGRVLPLNSFENRVFEVEIEPEGPVSSPSEKFRIIKFYRPGRWSLEQILEEHEFLNNLKNEEVPVVAPLLNPAQSTVGTLPGVAIYFSVFPKFGGRIWEELMPEHQPQVGRLLGKIHAIGKAKNFKHRLTLSPVTYGEKNLESLLESKKIPFHLEPVFQKTIESICQIATQKFEKVPLQRIHGDCHLGNLIINSEQACLIDYDDSVTGPTIQDFWLLLPGREADANRSLQGLIEGYDQMNSFDPNNLELVETLRALRWIHFWAWILKRWKDPIFPKTFPQFEEESFWANQLRDLQDQLSVIEKNTFWKV